MQKIPRWVRGSRPKWMVPSSPSERPSATLMGVDVADQVRDGDVGGRQLLGIAIVSVDPLDGRLVTPLGDQRARFGGDRGEGVVVHLAARHLRQPLVEQRHHRADHPALRLAAFSQKIRSWPQRSAFSTAGITVSS